VQQERRLLAIRYEAEPPVKLERWQQRVLRLQEMASWNFDAISEREYLTVASLYVLRHLAYSHEPVERVRLLAWLDALTERLLGSSLGVQA
jgi:lysyl-tRNA synthetase class I